MDKPSWTNRKIGDWFAASDYHLAIQMRDEFGAYITKLESQLAAAKPVIDADSVTWRCPECQSVTVDPADVTALQEAHKAALARIVELEAQLQAVEAERDCHLHDAQQIEADLLKVQAENVELKNGVAEMENELEQDLQAEQWQPLVEDEDLSLRRLQGETDGFMSTMYCGTAFFTDKDGDARFLPEGYCIAKVVQP